MEELQSVMEEESDEDKELYVRPSAPDFTFGGQERLYHQICEEIEDEPSLGKFKEQYTKLFDYLLYTRDRSEELDEEKNDLVGSVSTNDERLANCLKIIEADAKQIDELKTEIDTSLKLIDNAHAREQVVQEIIDNLRKQIANLNTEIDVKNKMAQGELEENPAAAKHREGLEREKAKLISEVSKLSEKLANALAYQEELERRTSLTDLRINDISSQLEETEADVDKYKRNKEKLEADLSEVNEEISKKSQEIESLLKQIQTNNKIIGKYDQQFKDQNIAAKKCFREFEWWTARFTKLQNEYDTVNARSERMKQENFEIIKDLHAKDDEKIHMQIEITKTSKERDSVDNKIRNLQLDRFNIEEEKNKLKEVILNMQRDLEAQKADTAKDKELIEEHIKQREVLNRNLLRQQAITRDQMKVIKVQEHARKRLDKEVDEKIIETRKQSKQIFYMEKERNRLVEEALDKAKKINTITDEFNLQNNYLLTLEKSLAEGEIVYKQKQAKLDEVRADRNALQKSMRQCTAETNELRSKLKIIHRQSEQLKEEIATKEQALIKEETIKRKILKEKEVVKVDLNTSWDKIRELEESISQKITEEKRLKKVINESNKIIKEQYKTITSLINERDVLGSQLVRRNDEISLVNEKIKIIQNTLYRGEAQYRERLFDIKLLKVEIKRLRQEGHLLKKSIANMTNFKIEVFQLERMLTKERMKSKALESELHNPVNIHRWRKLEGNDPDVPELLGKTALLQKRLLAQGTTMLDLERELKETENLYFNLRTLIFKQPDWNVQENMNKTQKSLFASNRKNKCLISELNMLELNNRKCTINLTECDIQFELIKQLQEDEEKKHEEEVQKIKIFNETIVRVQQTVEMPPIVGGDIEFPTITVKSLRKSKDSQ